MFNIASAIDMSGHILNDALCMPRPHYDNY